MIDNLLFYAQISNENILLSHKGAISTSIITHLCTEIHQLFRHNHQTERKIYSIFMELVQNIFYYSAEINLSYFSEEERVGLVVISEADTYYKITAGNLTTLEELEGIIEKIEYINTLDTQGLRKYRMQVIENPPIHKTKSRGAGVGLIKIALVSENELVLQNQKLIEDLAFFTLTIKIDK